MFLEQNLRKHLLTELASNQIQSRLLFVLAVVHFVHIDLFVLVVVFLDCLDCGPEVFGCGFPVVSGFFEAFCLAELGFLFLFHLFYDIGLY